ncbi:unnamed protein product, partial [marine sediment metagenome]
MVYSSNDEFAQSMDFANWKELEQRGIYPRKKKTLENDRITANSKINMWIGCKDTDITDDTYLPYLKGLEIEVIKRMHDKTKHRKAGEQQGIYAPHDYLYQAEREFLQTIGRN